MRSENIAFKFTEVTSDLEKILERKCRQTACIYFS